MPIAAILLVLLICLVSTGCDSGSSATQDDHEVATYTPECSDPIACKDRSDMAYFLKNLNHDVLGRYVGYQFGRDLKMDYVWQNSLHTGPTSCHDVHGSRVHADQNSFFYCATDRRLYVGLDSLYSYYTTVGYSDTAYAIAHAYGHHLQELSDIRPQNKQEAVQMELQADCIAGVIVDYWNDEGIFGLYYPDTYLDIEGAMRKVHNSEYSINTTDHGSIQERLEAFNTGRNEELGACVDLFPRDYLIDE